MSVHESAPAHPPHSRRLVPTLLAVVAVLLAALNLRAGIASLGPVLGDVLAAFGAASWTAGILTALPGLMFAIMGLAAVPLARRLGLSGAMTFGMVLSLIGLAVRPWVGQFGLFIALTAFVAAGIAVANVLLPAWIKSHGGRHVVALMTVYTAVLGVSSTIGPLGALLFEGEGAWQWSLFLWVALAAAQLVAWTAVTARTRHDYPSRSLSPGESSTRGSLWRSPTALVLMTFFGLQSMNAYIQMGWMPQIYLDAGMSGEVGAVALALVGALNIVGGIVMPWTISRVSRLWPFPVLFALCAASGYLGLFWAPSTLPLLWAFLLGVGGFCFPTALALIAARSRTALTTARLSGFVQPYGYIVAAVGPLLVGVIYGATGRWDEVLIALVVVAAVMAVIGLWAARPGFIDDEPQFAPPAAQPVSGHPIR